MWEGPSGDAGPDVSLYTTLGSVQTVLLYWEGTQLS